MKQAGFPLLLKKVFDRAVAAVGIVATAPIVGAAAIAVRSTMGGPVFFRQQRPGLGGRPFEIVKMRTMRSGPGTDAERLTKLGKFLRAASIDELPQLWNVAKGELSLVGPRPLLMQYLPLYNREQARRHDVLPGITGWAQVHGRNAISWEEKFALDVWYVDHWTPLLDLEILVKTAASVLKRDGISRDGHVTMPNFEGTVLN